MKKYEKPVLMFESYELSYNVANCSVALNHMEADTNCKIEGLDGIKFDGYTVFTAGSTCTYGPEIWEDYCKFTGTSNHNVFTS